MKRITFVLDDERHTKLKAFAALKGENISKVLRRAIDEYIAENETLSPKYTTPVKTGLKPRRIRHK